MDFQFDQTSDGRNLKLLNIIDELTREALATMDRLAGLRLEAKVVINDWRHDYDTNRPPPLLASPQRLTKRIGTPAN